MPYPDSCTEHDGSTAKKGLVQSDASELQVHGRSSLSKQGLPHGLTSPSKKPTLQHVTGTLPQDAHPREDQTRFTRMRVIWNRGIMSDLETWLPWLWTCEQSCWVETLRQRAITPTPRTVPASPSLPKEPRALGWDSLSGHAMLSNWTSPCKGKLPLLATKANEVQTCPSAVCLQLENWTTGGLKSDGVSPLRAQNFCPGALSNPGGHRKQNTVTFLSWGEEIGAQEAAGWPDSIGRWKKGSYAETRAPEICTMVLWSLRLTTVCPRRVKSPRGGQRPSTGHCK